MKFESKENLLNNKIERIPYRCMDLELLKLEEHYGLVKKRSRAKAEQPDIVNCICTFDIETTTTGGKENPLTWLYIWQFNLDGIVTIYGRTVLELRDFFKHLSEYNDGNVVIYVHNLAYEFQFLTGLFEFSQVLANGVRKPIKAVCGNLEFRCSYMLSNLSLANYCKQMGVRDKLSGEEFNYKKLRTPSTPLSDRELEYCFVDVESLAQCIQKHLDMENDTLITIPTTSTGYVRREVKTKLYWMKEKIKECTPPTEVYEALRNAYRGGNCHANRFYSGKIVKNTHSRDMKSAYPTAICTRPFPMGEWLETNISKYDEVADLIKGNQFALIMEITLEDVSTDSPCPYLSVDKMESIVESDEYSEDNGRILKARMIRTWVTDIDFCIINNTYSFSHCKVHKCYRSKYGMLLKPFRAVVQEYFDKKTSLKGIASRETFYALAKAKLNSIYGMTVQVMDKDEIVYSPEDGWSTQHVKSYQDLLDEGKFMLPYSWGVWTSAWCRYMLYEGIEIVGDDFIYCDTDSVKYIGDHDFTKLNEERVKLAKKHLQSTDIKGNIHYGGVYEEDGAYDKFVTLGAKRYAYTDSKGLHITVAGVNKKLGAKEIGHIENFKDGFVFYHSGKTTSKYIDHPEHDKVVVDGEEIEILPYVSILESTYNMSLGKEYRNLLDSINGIVYNKSADAKVSM